MFQNHEALSVYPELESNTGEGLIPDVGEDLVEESENQPRRREDAYTDDELFS